MIIGRKKNDHGLECYLNETKIVQRTSQKICIGIPWILEGWMYAFG